MNIDEQSQYVTDNHLYLVATADGKLETLDAVDTLRKSWCMAAPLYIPEYRIVFDDALEFTLPTDPSKVTTVSLEESPLTQDLEIAMIQRSGHQAAIYPLTKTENVKSGRQQSVTSPEEAITKLLIEIKNQPDKMIDLSKFNPQTGRGAKVVDRPRGKLRTKKTHGGYPFIFAADDQDNIVLATGIYDNLYGNDTFEDNTEF